MARTFTNLELYTRLEEITDTENDAHISAVEKRNAINQGISEAWDHICNSGLGEKYVKSVTFTTVAGTMEYSLASVASDGDFYRIHQLYVVESTDFLRPLKRVQPGELMGFKAPTQSGITLKLYYIPCAPELDPTNQGVWEAGTFDGINGWEDLVLMCAAFRIKAKKDDGYNPYAQRKAELINRIAQLGNVDFGEPARVSRKRRRDRRWYPFDNHIDGYGVRGDKIELYFFDGYVPW